MRHTGCFAWKASLQPNFGSLPTPGHPWQARDAVAAARLHMIGIGRAASTKPCLRGETPNSCSGMILSGSAFCKRQSGLALGIQVVICYPCFMGFIQVPNRARKCHSFWHGICERKTKFYLLSPHHTYFYKYILWPFLVIFF